MSMRAIMAVRDYSQTSGAEYALMLIIADGVDSSVGLMRGRDTYKLARMAHLCAYDATESQQHNARRRCQRMITALMKRGELIVITGGHRAKNQYIIPILPGEPGYNPQPCTDMDHDCNRYHTPLDVSREQEAMNEADRRLNLENMGRRLTPAAMRGAAPEPPQTRPIDRPKTKTARGAAPEPPQTRPIDRPTAAPEPPQTRPIGRTVSHSNPINDPNMIPAAVPPTEKNVKREKATGRASEGDARDTAPTPPLPPSPHAIDDLRPGDMEPTRLWGRVIATLQATTPAAQMASWIYPARIARYGWDADDTLCVELAAPGSAHARMIEDRFGYLISDAVARVYNLPASRVALSIVCAAQVARG